MHLMKQSKKLKVYGNVTKSWSRATVLGMNGVNNKKIKIKKKAKTEKSTIYTQDVTVPFDQWMLIWRH